MLKNPEYWATAKIEAVDKHIAFLKTYGLSDSPLKQDINNISVF